MELSLGKVIFIIFLIIIIIVFILMNNHKNKTIFQPARQMKNQFDDIDDIFINTNSGKINCWIYHKNYPKTILFCHGSNLNISYRKYIYDFCVTAKVNLVLFDYYGYGKSEGTPNKKNIYSCSEYVYLYIKKQYHQDKIIIWGESLGGTVAGYLASKYNCYKLILMCTFSSLEDILYYNNPKCFKNKLICFLLRKLNTTFPTKDFIGKVKCPIMIIHSIDDEVIPYENSQVLFCHIEHVEKYIIKIKGTHSKPEFTGADLSLLVRFIEVDIDNFKDFTL